MTRSGSHASPAHAPISYLVGALLAPVFGRVAGVFVAFLLPFLDIAISQRPMLHPDPGLGVKVLPGYGGGSERRVLGSVVGTGA